MATHKEVPSCWGIDRGSYEVFLVQIWGPPSSSFSGSKERKTLPVETVARLSGCLVGGWCYQSRRQNLTSGRHAKEFYLAYPRNLRISAYRHCVPRNFRQQALVWLWEEPAYHVRRLCKSCHGMTHHAPAQWVEHGISTLSNVYSSTVMAKGATVVCDLSAGNDDWYHQFARVSILCNRCGQCRANGRFLLYYWSD
jgi:hypothetical protein